MVLFLFSFKDITESRGRSHLSDKKEGEPQLWDGNRIWGAVCTVDTWQRGSRFPAGSYLTSCEEVTPKQPCSAAPVLPLTQCVLSAAEKQKTKKPGSSHLRAARRQGQTVLHRLSSQFARGDRGEMKINRVRTPWTTMPSIPSIHTLAQSANVAH